MKNTNTWIYEKESYNIEPKFTKIKWKIKKILCKNKSKYQEIAFYDSYDHGIILTLDNVIMLTEKDEFIYHEALAHIPIFSHPKPQKLLVVGGGDLGILRETLKHNDIKQLHLCEIDKMVTRKCIEFLPYAKTVAENHKVKLFFEDGFNFLQNKTNYYDIIIVDSSDPIGQAEKLFDNSFFKLVHNSLKKDGIMSMQGGSPFYNTNFIIQLANNLKKIFHITKLYTASCHSYPGGYWGFILASKQYCPNKNFQKNKYHKINIKCKYYNQNIHKAAFALPEYLKNALRKT